MYRIKFLITFLLSFIILFSCSNDKHADVIIDNAMAIIDEKPDSALTLLNNIRGKKTEWPKSQRMRYELVYAQAKNKAFVPFTSDSIALEVEQYYNRHGSANERMLASYMVGCVYRDLGDAPSALKHLRTAAEHADTSAHDCDFTTLMRLHSQMGGLYQAVEAFENERIEDHLAEQIAWQIGDTISALHLMWLRACSLGDARLYDHSLALLDSIENFGNVYGINIPPSLIYPIRIDERLQNKDSQTAKKWLDAYEQKAGISPNGSLSENTSDIGYYQLKGNYYNLVGLPDSAIKQYRNYLECCNSTDLNPIERLEIRENYYKGLLEAYTLKHQPDSIVKYAHLYCQLNDSTTRGHSSKLLLQMQSLYNYTKAQEDAYKYEQKALKLRSSLLFFIVAAVLSCLGIWRAYRKRLYTEKQDQTAHNIRYIQLLQKYEKSAAELQLLISDSEQLRKEKEEENEKLRKALSLYQADTLDLETWDEERSIINSEVVEHLHVISAHGQKATQDEFESLYTIVLSALPGFYSIISNEASILSEKEKIVCTLIRVHFIASEIAVLTGLSPQRITNIKSAINRKLFNAQGAKNLEKRLAELK